MNKIEALKKTEIFGHLTVKELGVVAQTCVERRLKKKEILFNAGDESRGLYVIVVGSLRAFRSNPEGREQIIHVEKAGTTIAEFPVFDDKPYPSTVFAKPPLWPNPYHCGKWISALRPFWPRNSKKKRQRR